MARENREHKRCSQQNRAQHYSHHLSPLLCFNQALRAIRRRSRRTGVDLRQTIALQESRISRRIAIHESRRHLIQQMWFFGPVASVAGPDSPGRIPGNRGLCFPAHVATFRLSIIPPSSCSRLWQWTM
jgi:hypothetical protein